MPIPGIGKIPKRMQKALSLNEKESIYNAYENLSKTTPNASLNDIMKTVASLYGIHWVTVFKIKREMTQTGCLREPIKTKHRKTVLEKMDRQTKRVIRDIVNGFFERNEDPTILKILKAANDSNIGTFKRSSFYKILDHLGFNFNNKSPIVLTDSDSDESFSGGEPKKEGSFPVKTEDTSPGPSDLANPDPSDIAKPGRSIKAKRGAPKKPQAKSIKENESTEMEFIAVTGTPVKKMHKELALPESLNTAETGGGNRILKYSTATSSETLPNKRARLDDTNQPESVAEVITSDVITSELIIKDDPDSFESILLPSVIYEKTVVKQEIPETIHAMETANYVIDPLDYDTCLPAAIITPSAVQSQETETHAIYDLDVEVKVEKTSDIVSEVKKNKEEDTSLETVILKVEETPEICDSTTNSEHLLNRAEFHSTYEILKDLLEKKLISTVEKNILVSHKLEVRLLQGRQGATFNPKLKAFAIALYVYSHKAYDYVRTNYKTCLPVSAILMDWLVQPRGHSGFTRDTLEAINKKVTSVTPQLSVSQKIFVCLVLKDINMAPSRAYKRPNQSKNIINPLDWSVATAKAAFVMTAAALNADWKVPIGYFWTNVVKGSERANLVKVAISILETVGVEPVAVSFEYNNENLQMCSELNCSVNKTNLKTSFLSESGKLIFIFPDFHGILEVIYRDFNFYDMFVDESSEIVCLTHITLLLKRSHDLQSASKQLLRKTIASEIFKNDFNVHVGPGPPSGILSFLKNIHIVLDVLSSRKGGLNLKDAVSNVTDVAINPAVVALQGAGKYFKSLRFTKTMLPLWATDKGLGILGLCALIDSALMLICKYSNQFSIQFGKFVGNPSYFLANLTPLEQDGKYPTSFYFQKEYKAMLQHIDLLSRLKVNNVAIENISLLKCPSAIDRINLTTNLPNGNKKMHVVGDLWKLHRCGIPEFDDKFIVYVARFVTHSLIRQLNCDTCIRAIRSRPDESVVNVDITMINAPLLVILENPSIAAMNVCKTAEADFIKAVKHSGGEALNPNFNVPFLLTKVMKKYVNRPLFENLVQHQFDTDRTCNHVVELTKAVTALYLETRIQLWKQSLSGNK